jgi:DNA/RNA-binding domain of Phe-tRNA-synthetase-like protein
VGRRPKVFAMTAGGRETVAATPFSVAIDLPGWELLWARLEPTGSAGDELAALRREIAGWARARHELGSLAADAAVAAMRRLFKAVGCDPSRYRPSSEALLRRLVKGEELPAISPLVDLNNCLSARLAVPCCVMDEAALTPPFRFRAGHPGEAYESLRGPFELAGRPLLLDASGPCDTPITGNTRVKVLPQTRAAWLVAYLPSEAIDERVALRELDRLLQRAPVAMRGSAFAAEHEAVGA